MCTTTKKEYKKVRNLRLLIIFLNIPTLMVAIIQYLKFDYPLFNLPLLLIILTIPIIVINLFLLYTDHKTKPS